MADIAKLFVTGASGQLGAQVIDTLLLIHGADEIVAGLLLISSSENGKRRTQHRNVVEAARQAGVGFIAYTSILHAETSPLFLAEEHCDTEAAIIESGVPYALLRNGWYSEVYTWRLPAALKVGV